MNDVVPQVCAPLELDRVALPLVHARRQQDRLAAVVEHAHVPLLHSDLRPQIANVNSIERGAKNSLVSKAFG